MPQKSYLNICNFAGDSILCVSFSFSKMSVTTLLHSHEDLFFVFQNLNIQTFKLIKKIQNKDDIEEMAKGQKGPEWPSPII